MEHEATTKIRYPKEEKPNLSNIWRYYVLVEITTKYWTKMKNKLKIVEEML